MLNAFIAWLIENWNVIVIIFMWGLSLLMVFVLVAKIYKIVKLDFELRDLIGLIVSGLWLLAIIIFGFNHITQYLQSFL